MKFDFFCGLFLNILDIFLKVKSIDEVINVDIIDFLGVVESVNRVKISKKFIVDSNSLNSLVKLILVECAFFGEVLVLKLLLEIIWLILIGFGLDRDSGFQVFLKFGLYLVHISLGFL